MTTTCPRCPATWTGHRIEHCGVCHETFTGSTAGDMHRTGDYNATTGPERRRCLDVAEMHGKGMTQNFRGQWTTGREMPERLFPPPRVAGVHLT